MTASVIFKGFRDENFFFMFTEYKLLRFLVTNTTGCLKKKLCSHFNFLFFFLYLDLIALSRIKLNRKKEQRNLTCEYIFGGHPVLILGLVKLKAFIKLNLLMLSKLKRIWYFKVLYPICTFVPVSKKLIIYDS